MDVIGKYTNDRILHAIITMKTMIHQSWGMSSVYAPTSAEERQQGWNENRSISTINEGYVVAGDFNCMLRQKDKYEDARCILGN